MKKLLFILLTVLLLVASASATINITAGPISQTAITWSWTTLSLTGMYIDGVAITGFYASTTHYTLSNLKGNETHTLQITTSTDTGSSTATTLPDSQEQSYSLLNTWWYLLLIVVLVVVGMMRRLGIFLPVASAVSLWAEYILISNNTVTASNFFVELPFIIYLIFFIVPLWLCFGVKGGVFR